MDDARQRAPISEGDVLGGKYQVERVIGRGGMGVVVAATHLQLQERVALKFLLLEVTKEGEHVARFLREARAAVKIKSEHVARVTDVGTLENGAPFMVMEYLEGDDLAAVVARRGPLPIEAAVAYILQACVALAAAHKAGIVHRDLKPANLFLVSREDGSPCVKVLDFGISKVTAPSAPDAGLTTAATIMGTPIYMSPEQLRSSRDVDATTDIWSLGVILFELLTGEVPFSAETVPDLCVAVLSKPAPRPRTLRADIPPALEDVVLRCLKKDPGDRFQTMRELAQALAPFARNTDDGTLGRFLRSGRAESGPSPEATTVAVQGEARPGFFEGGATEIASVDRAAAPAASRVRLVQRGVAAAALLAILSGIAIARWARRDAGASAAPAASVSVAIAPSAAPLTSASLAPAADVRVPDARAAISDDPMPAAPPPDVAPSAARARARVVPRAVAPNRPQVLPAVSLDASGANADFGGRK